MEIINEDTLGLELKRWFSKSVFDYSAVDFADREVFKEVCAQFIFDYNRYYEGDSILLKNLLLRAELHGILLYRLARVYFLKGNEDVAQAYSLLGRFLSGFEIYYSAQIGKSLKINHGLGTVVGARVVIGDNALLHQGVTFGDRKGGRPTLKNNVIVYAGAKILGNVTIGNNAIIAANSVSINDVPDHATVAGMPAKLINSKK